jgi:hypothetical protein
MHNDCEPNSSAVPQNELRVLRDQGLAVVAMRTSPESSEIIVFVEASAAEYSKVVTLDINEV